MTRHACSYMAQLYLDTVSLHPPVVTRQRDQVHHAVYGSDFPPVPFSLKRSADVVHH